ncbi:MAG: Hpt domain-containing protein [Hespellia sp.]|nr:Hpt domain-containing protein [Hespellia sp.]
MTVKECYEAMGADYEDVMGRLRTDERVQKFLLKVLNDKSYDLLCTSIESGDMNEAFRAAHTLKGVCQNLSLTPLYHSASELSERLRGGQAYGEDMEPMLDQVKRDYAQMTECIQGLL